MMRAALLVVALLAGRASADDTPVVTADGKLIIVPQREEDARFEGFKFVVYDRRGIAIDERAIATAGEERPPASATRSAAAAKWLHAFDAARHLKPLTRANDVTSIAALGPTGTLTVTPPGHRPVTKASPGWRTEPDAAQAAVMKAKSDRGEIECFNAARIGDVWLDLPRRVAVVHITFRGSDTCWEPAGGYAVFTW